MLFIIALFFFQHIDASQVENSTLLLSTIDQYNENYQKKALLNDIKKIVDAEVTKTVDSELARYSSSQKEALSQPNTLALPNEHKTANNAMCKKTTLSTKKITMQIRSAKLSDIITLINKTANTSIIFFEQQDPLLKQLYFVSENIDSLLTIIGSKLKPPFSLLEEDNKIFFSSTHAKYTEQTVDEYIIKKLDISNAIPSEDLKKRLETIWLAITQKNPNSIMNLDVDTRSITVRGTKAQIKEFKEFIKSVNHQKERIKIDMIFILKDKLFGFEFGLNWSGIYNRQQSITQQGKPFGFTGIGGTLLDYPTPTEPVVGPDGRTYGNLYVNPNNFSVNLFNTALDAASNVIYNVVNSAATFLQLPIVFGGKDLNKQRLNLILNAAEEEKTLKIVARPTILATNNQIGKLLVGTALPIYTTVQDVVQSNIRTLNQLTYKEVGISAQILPTISQNRKNISLDIYCELSDVLSGTTVVNATGVNQNPPVLRTVKLKNHIVLDDGQTAIIGGLLRTDEQSVTLKVPKFADLPLIGRFFRSNSNNKGEEEIFIFITPTIIE